MESSLKGALLALILQSLACAQLGPGVAHPYHTIIERNPFGLRPLVIAAPPRTLPPPKIPKGQIHLTGITTVGYPKVPKRAYLARQGLNASDLFSLVEGETSGDVRVVAINEKKRTVLIRNGNEGEVLLSFKSGAASGTGPAGAKRCSSPSQSTGIRREFEPL